MTADQGNWEWESGRPTTDVFFTHKTCSDAFRREHPEIDTSDELALFPLYLNDNLDIDLKAVKRAANRSDQV